MKLSQVPLAAALNACFFNNPGARVRFTSAAIVPPAQLQRFLGGMSALSDGQETDVRLWIAKHHPQVHAFLKESEATVPPDPDAPEAPADRPALRLVGNDDGTPSTEH